MNYKKLTLLLILAILPWLAMTHFYTKGEPREAIVAQTMLSQHNWILPTNNGGEMAYKPPFFHWCAAAASLPFGDVNEWSARFPSSLAAIILLVWMYAFYRKRSDNRTATLATLLCLTSFEVWRAAFACRVDMVLTLGIVGALFAFAEWSERERRGIPWLAILMMSIGTLTKGPVAMLLPCGVTGAYLLMRGENFFSTLLRMVGAGTASLILPACWYWAAYQQGGEQFLALVREENVDRFLGKMSYASHENPWWYNVEMLLAGLLPWTLFVIGKWIKQHCPYKMEVKGLWQRLRALPTVQLYSLLSFVIIFVFYCIPKSKRGVYLLPVYPFAAWFIALYLRDIATRWWRWILGVVLGLWVTTFAIALPLIMNHKSDRDIALEVEQISGNNHLTSYIWGSAPGNPMHFFTINYYLHNRVDAWNSQSPHQGYILITDSHVNFFREEFPNVLLTEVYTSSHKSCDTKGMVKMFKYSIAQ